MAMDNERLGDAMVDTVLACISESPVAADVTKLRTLMRALAQDIITEILDNAEITTTTSTPGAQSGSSTLPGTGTGEVSA